MLILPLFDSCSGKAKPSKRAKKNKPVEDPRVNEPEQQTPAPEISIPQSSEPVLDNPPATSDPPMERAIDESLNPEVSSPPKTADVLDEDVTITATGFREPGRPTVLAKHSAKEEHKVRFDMADYSHLSIGEVFSGYLSQVHSSRDLEVDMVKQMHQKFEV